MKIDITEEHIKNGRRGNSHSCPVALAIKEQVPGAKHVVVGREISINGVCYSTPHIALLFVWNFDQRGPAGSQPCRFEFPYENESSAAEREGE